MGMNRLHINLAGLLALAGILCCGGAQAEDLENTFYAMGTAFFQEPAPPAEQAAIAAELGYAGLSYERGLEIPKEMLDAVDAHDVRLFCVYLPVSVEPGVSGVPEHISKAFDMLKGRDTLVWLTMVSKTYECSSEEGDADAVRILRDIAAAADEAGLRLALYPHVNNWVERARDAQRVAEKAGRANLGATFNLCHWLAEGGDEPAADVLKDMLPKLFMLTLNGADCEGQGWNRLIQTLDQGSYDIHGFLQDVHNVGYKGPIGLQCYGIQGDPREMLTNSMNAWKHLRSGIDADWVKPFADGLGGFRDSTGEWTMAGDVTQDPDDPKAFTWTAGGCEAVNGPEGRTAHLVTKAEHGDIVAHIEFMVPEGSNSGVYFQGRYEIQVLDSWGVAAPEHSDCGGIYQRWDDNRDPKGFEGRPPRVNAARRPGQWQTFDVLFRAPRFDASGNKTANAMFVRVEHNGVVIHENQEVTGPTRAAMYAGEQPRGPIMLQGDHGPVAYRNLRFHELGK